MRILILCLLIGLLIAGDGIAAQDDRRLSPLFSGLVKTGDLNEATKLEERIWSIWLESPRPDVSDKMRRGVAAMSRGNLNEALELFDEITRLQPKFAEGWNKRATVHYLMREFDASVRDIVKTLALEPRHFGALSGLGLIQEAVGQPEAAIRAFEKALAIHPHLGGARKSIQRLRTKLRGKET
jgi:tetratricopeptide (TPR) repeat protein